MMSRSKKSIVETINKVPTCKDRGQCSMIIYRGSTTQFDYDVRYNKIADILEQEFIRVLGRGVSPAERRSFQNSLSKINEVLINEGLNSVDCGVLLEYHLPQSSMRLDFMITGKDKFLNANAVIVELKQWDHVEESNTERQVVTYTGGDFREVNHPAVQVTNYKQYLMDYHSAFHSDNNSAIKLYTCSYLHNYQLQEQDKLFDSKFDLYIVQSPVFTKKDVRKIGNFLKNHVEKGDGMELVDYIASSIPKPSKKLINHINNIIDAKSEFILMDEQLVVFDRVMQIVRDQKLDGSDGKYVVLIKGGPGTGKSVVGLNLLGKILQNGKECVYLAPNAAFKNSMANKIDKERASRLFKHPYYYNRDLIENNRTYPVAIVDEAHRISSTPPPMQKKLDKSLVEEIIEKTHLTVFFTDDNQMIRPKDIGSYSHVKETAQKLGCTIYEYELNAQFRCAGSEGYLNWLDDVLGIRQTANASGWENLDDLQFYIFDDPNEMKAEILKLQKQGFDSRLLAGYAWPWSKELTPDGQLKNDVKIYEDEELIFEMPWNPQDSYRGTKRAPGIPLSGADWAINPDGVNQIGCIHTCQGLEFDYVGVIIGEEFTYNLSTESWEADVTKCYDAKIGKNSQDQFLRLAQNTYKTLLSRGMKGVFVYSVDKDTREYLKRRLKVIKEIDQTRFYNHKQVNLHDLFLENRARTADEIGGYSADLEIKLEKYNISPISNGYYYCDIIEEQIFFDKIRDILCNTLKETTETLLAIIKEKPQIRNYATPPKGLTVDVGIFKIEPELFVKRIHEGKEVISMIFKSKQLN